MNFLSSHIKLICLVVVFFQPCIITAQNRISIEGVVYDEYDYPIPYASVGILKKKFIDLSSFFLNVVLKQLYKVFLTK